eukprot:5724712-Alexandrium_andersonii.AAC.1
MLLDHLHDFVICKCPVLGDGPLAFVAQGLVVRSVNVEADVRGVWAPLPGEAAQCSVELLGPLDHAPT